jgi:hypothetical protein
LPYRGGVLCATRVALSLSLTFPDLLPRFGSFAVAVVFLTLVVLMGLAWYALRLLFPNQPKLRVMGLFGATHKTVAMGLPLVSAIYDGDPNVGLYSLPLLCWHSLQLLLGSILAPKLAAFVEREELRLGTAAGEAAPKRDEEEASPPPPPADPAVAAEEGRAPPPASGSVSCTSTVVMKGSMAAVDKSTTGLDEDVSDRSR